jgi:hypothetical protein
MKRLIVYLLLAGVVGCGSEHYLEQSEFFIAGSQWIHSETAFPSTDELVFNGRRITTTEGQSTEKSHFTLLLTITVSSNSDGINKFIRGLRANLEVFAQQTGTIIVKIRAT